MRVRFAHSLSCSRELSVELGQDFEEVADQAVIGDLEDRRLLILVDRDDDLGILHTGEMLDRAGDADRDVKLRRDDLAGLADLIVVGDEPGIDRGARRADRGAELVGDRLDQMEIVARLHAAPARDDDPGAGQLGPLGFRQLGLDELGEAGRAGAAHRLDRSRAALGRARRKRGAAHGDDLDRVLRLHRRQRVAGIDRAHERILRDNAADVGDLHHVEQRGDARHQILALRRRRGEQMRVLRRQADQQRRDILGEAVAIGRVVGDQHLRHAGDLGGGIGGGAAILAGDEDVDVAGAGLRQLGGGGGGVQGGGLDRIVVVLGDDENSHQMTLASVLSLVTSSSTEPTLTPPWRFAGSSTLSVTRRGATSTPRSSGLNTSIGFFLAFMMLGSDA